MSVDYGGGAGWAEGKVGGKRKLTPPLYNSKKGRSSLSGLLFICLDKWA
jgi:hypothetical protein